MLSELQIQFVKPLAEILKSPLVIINFQAFVHVFLNLCLNSALPHLYGCN